MKNMTASGAKFTPSDIPFQGATHKTKLWNTCKDGDGIWRETRRARPGRPQGARACLHSQDGHAAVGAKNASAVRLPAPVLGSDPLSAFKRATSWGSLGFQFRAAFSVCT